MSSGLVTHLLVSVTPAPRLTSCILEKSTCGELEDQGDERDQRGVTAAQRDDIDKAEADALGGLWEQCS